MKTIVISGINLFEGGPLSVYKDCLDNIIQNYINLNYEIIAFVHKKELFIEYEKKITLIEIPKSRKNYLFRLWYEYVYFYFFSKSRNIDVWLSLHDMTPNVKAKKQYVYCHNPSPFMKSELKNIRYSYKNFFFSLFYKYLYKINIKRNTAIIVQQEWIRNEFINVYGVENIIVAKPSINIEINNKCNSKENYESKEKIFIYPAFPRFFKNFEVICEACKILNAKGINNFKVILTIDGSENRYSYEIVKRYEKVESICFVGLKSRDEIFNLYEESDCMIFSSKLETWGLPISEFKGINKPIILAKLPYALETVGTYEKVNFFNPDNADQLAILMEKEINLEKKYEGNIKSPIKKPYSDNWMELFEYIL